MGTIRTQERAKGVSVWFFSCLSSLAMCSTTEKMKKIKKIDNAINIVKDEV